MLLIVLFLAACSPQQESVQANEFAEALEAATAALDEVRAGTRHVEKGSATAPFGTPIDEYRLQRLKAAADNLRSYANSSNAAQKAAATRLLAAAAAADSRYNLRQASNEWANLSPSAARLSELATRAIVSQEALSAQAAVSQSQQIADLQTREQQLTSQVDEITTRFNQISNVVTGHEEAIAGFESQRQQRALASSDLSSRAFKSAGQLGYDLTLQAASESRAADALSAQSESHRIELDIASSRKTLIETELNHTRAQLDRVRQAIAAARTRAQQNATATADARTHAEQVVQEFGQIIRELAEAKSTVINPLLDQITTQATEAASQFASLKNASPSRQGGQDTTLAAAAGTVSAALAIRAAAEIHSSYAELLTTTAARIEASMPNQAAQLNDAAAPAAASANELITAAHEQFNNVVADLDSLGNSGGDTGNAALNILAQAYDTMATDMFYSGDSDEAQRLFTLRQQTLDRIAPATP